MIVLCFMFVFFKQKTAYEMRISDWSSDVCSSDLARRPAAGAVPARIAEAAIAARRSAYRLYLRLVGLGADPRAQKGAGAARRGRRRRREDNRPEAGREIEILRGRARACPYREQLSARRERDAPVRRLLGRRAVDHGGRQSRGRRDRKSTRLNSRH